MGNRKKKWKAEESEALVAGVTKYGPGRWKMILADPEFAPYLTQRTNTDLKDKWRNLSISPSGERTEEKSRTPKIKAAAVAPTVSAGTLLPVASGTPSMPSSTPNAPPVTLIQNGASPVVVDGIASNGASVKNVPGYNELVFEALSTIKDENGSGIDEIINFIEQRQEVPQYFRKLLGARLRRLIYQRKLEKVENRYKIRDDADSAATTTATMKQEDIAEHLLLGTSPAITCLEETLEEAAMAAATKVAEAESKSFLATEAMREAERMAKLAEDCEAVLQIAMEIHKRCNVKLRPCCNNHHRDHHI